MSKDSYYKHKAISQSSLKLLDFNPKVFYEREQRWLDNIIEDKPKMEVSESMLLGSTVDCLILTPELFNDQFIVLDEKPTGQMLSFVEELIKLDLKSYSDTCDIEDIAKQAYTKVGFKREGLDSVLNNFEKKGLKYFKARCKYSQDQIITSEIHKEALRLKKLVETDRFVGSLFKELNPKHVQFEIYDNFENIAVKGLLDMIVVDETSKTIQPYDLKITNESNFYDTFYYRRYDLQAAFYTLLLKKTDYKILPFKFIVINIPANRIETYTTTETIIHNSTIGFTKNNKTYKGCIELLKQYNWHKTENLWEYPMNMYLNHGILTLE